ncbi:MAG: carboxyvinyl-carboxyphosphonate phosphorylmutase, partial [Bauldia sp.]
MMHRGASAEFRERVLAQKTVWMGGAYDAFSARMIERAGFEGIMTSGFGVSASLLGMPDAEL